MATSRGGDNPKKWGGWGFVNAMLIAAIFGIYTNADDIKDWFTAPPKTMTSTQLIQDYNYGSSKYEGKTIIVHGTVEKVENEKINHRFVWFKDDKYLYDLKNHPDSLARDKLPIRCKFNEKNENDDDTYYDLAALNMGDIISVKCELVGREKGSPFIIMEDCVVDTF